MTQENFNYRTSPLFLRNGFDSNEPWSIPVIPKCNVEIDSDLRLIGFDKVKDGKDTHFGRAVHFFLYDYKFEKIWDNPQKYVEQLKKYKAVLSPDFSMYIEMNPVMQLYNTFRNRWIGAFLADKGIKVIPTVNWGLENTFDFCFNGIEKGSTVAVSTYMVSEHGNHEAQKEFFMNGYNEMLKRIEPEQIICYSKPFPEMEGNIVYIDYDLSSWQHYSDDEQKSFQKTIYTMITKYGCGCVCGNIDKGSGSAFGGKWKPQKEDDERFIGTPGEIKTTYTNKGSMYQTKIGSNGYAIRERHYTDHSNPKIHSNPHDHIIDWSMNRPNPGKPINYCDEVPELKLYEGGLMSTKPIKDDSGRFESIADFKDALVWGREIEFEWNGKEYGAFHEGDGDEAFYLGEAYKDGVYFSSVDSLLDYKIDGRPLRKIITEVIVWSRNV